jgi:soluble lytic murein transglycosylase-like protein
MSIPSRWVVAVTALAAVAGVAAIALGGGDGGSSGPAPVRRVTNPQEISAQLLANDAALRGAIDRWRAAEDPPVAPASGEVIGRARYLQTRVRFLARHPRLAEATIRLLPARLARELRELTGASRKLLRLSRGVRPRKLRTGPPRPLAELLNYYRAAKRRYGIQPGYLAAIHLVETTFGRVKSKSVAGARGPMQFMPSTWRIYGRGGDIDDPHDAILAAANLLRHNGAPGSYARALYAYNPSRLYVGAVQRYARVIAGDPYAVYFLYSWEP